MSDEAILDTDNQVFRQAVSFVNQTNQLIFLTGKAGTGKTTFLKYIRNHSHKKMVVAAPTGVAAMNAGGTTLHSLFWLPFGLYIADYEQDKGWNDGQVYNRQRLFSKVKLTKRKRELLREIELLVIDEVSMLRADMLDAIDALLKSVRRDARPFGGLQLLLIGDLFQLPPVVRESEWHIMAGHYRSPFFFDAHVLTENPPVQLELEKIYRQNDEVFINILNAIRENTCTASQLEQLNAYYNPDFAPQGGESYITITSHNYRADAINEKALATLPGAVATLKARIRGDFGTSLYPVDTELRLKKGAQVMFVRNDVGEDRRFYNGKIGRVRHIDSAGDSLIVAFDDGTEEVEVKREVWENIQYEYDQQKDKVNEDVLGTFSQFPLRLAWAITIHKSQGLTFERAIIDAEASFAAGQVYVALSRMTGLQGLVLKSRIPAHSIRTDPEVLNFAHRTPGREVLSELLELSQRRYLGHILMDSFKWDVLADLTSNLVTGIEKRSIPEKDRAVQVLKALHLAVGVQVEVSGKFRGQLQGLLFNHADIDYHKVLERTSKAREWFGPRLQSQLIEVLEGHVEEWEKKKRTKSYVQELKTTLAEFKRKQIQVEQCLEIAETLAGEIR